jgi:hypothetical protein
MIEKGMNQKGNDRTKSLFENRLSRTRHSLSVPLPVMVFEPVTVS